MKRLAWRLWSGLLCGGWLWLSPAAAEWQAVFGDAGDDLLQTAAVTADGGYLFGGSTDQGDHLDSVYFVVKTDAQGAKQWQKTYRGFGGGLDTVAALPAAPDGGFLVVGSSSASPTNTIPWWVGEKAAPNYGKNDFWVIKIDAQGNREWDQSYGGAGDDMATAALRTADGGYLLGGYSNSGPGGNKSAPNRGDWDFWVVKIAPDGQKLWDASFGGAAADMLNAFVATTDGGVLLGGLSFSGVEGTKTAPPLGSRDFYVVKIDPEGRQQWDAVYGGSGQDECKAIVPRPSGYLLGGWSDSSPGASKSAARRGFYDFWVVAIDSAGNRLWDQSYGGDGRQFLNAALASPDGGFLLGGSSDSERGGNKTSRAYGGSDFWVLKADAAGDPQWDQSYGGSAHDILSALALARDGGYVLAGSSYSPAEGAKTAPGLGKSDFWVVKVATAVAPKLLGQPQGVTVSGGRMVAFTVSALSDSPARYQWRLNGVDLAGATNATLMLANVQASQGGRYTVVVSNDFGAVESQTATLTYTDAADLLLTIHPSLTLSGAVGRSYRVEYTEDLTAPLRWATLASVLLTNNPQVWADLQAPAGGPRIYRVIEQP